ncbi:hypothetical protein MSKU15_0660 [Komagataeibacter diospyri]|uniref:hypothetical protein n=1 Tax=Komagataeibacter diospyri TaxID=1932662 RepID=UPI00113D3863|nr:hypothetical protein [Komagataeibacter diospyri]GCE89059.1 hypothetical protein MSKU15_0660 [Komagataeibacter diospyri]
MGTNFIVKFSDIQITGNWELDNLAGREFATSLIRTCQRTRNILPLVRACQDISQAGNGNGVRTGFFFALAESAILHNSARFPDL